MPPALTAPPNSTASSARAWLDSMRQSCDMAVREIALAGSKEWTFDGHRLRHASGGFFSVVGATAHMNGKRDTRFDQPLIDQPEIGILGFLLCRGGGAARILLQAKPEPGNVALVQAAPSVQATESNYRRRHRGKPTPLIEFFLHAEKRHVLSDSLQSEQGTRFLGKYNRNMIVEVGDSPAVPESDASRWFPVSDVHPMLLEDFQINTDARSVIASGPWDALAADGQPFNRWRGRGGHGEALLRSFEALEARSALPTREIAGRLATLRAAADFDPVVVDLTDLQGWEMSEAGMIADRHDAFCVRQFAIESTEREVASWDQPLIASEVEGLAVLLCQERNGLLHFLFDARREIGFRERFQYGPTIQDLGHEPAMLPTLLERQGALELALRKAMTIASCRQSDEGGRFFRCISRYSICELPPQEHVDLGGTLAWMTLRQVQQLVARPGFFSNEARSLISMVLAYL